jgi:hypothetical protein
MKNSEHLSPEQMQAFLEGNEEVGFRAANRKELYEWTQETLCTQGYIGLHRSGKGLVKQYISKVTGLSRAQATRLIAQYEASGIVEVRRGRPELKKDHRGKTVRAYKWYATPWEILRQTPGVGGCLKDDVTVEQMEKLAGADSDTVAATKMQKEKQKLFASFEQRRIA